MKTFYFKIYIGQRYFKSHTRKFNNDICQFNESKWNSLVISILFIYLFISFIFISWRLITLQCCSGFCHTLTWITHGFTRIPHPHPPPTSLPTRILWVFPVQQARALVSCIQPGLVICWIWLSPWLYLGPLTGPQMPSKYMPLSGQFSQPETPLFPCPCLLPALLHTEWLLSHICQAVCKLPNVFSPVCGPSLGCDPVPWAQLSTCWTLCRP